MSHLERGHLVAPDSEPAALIIVKPQGHGVHDPKGMGLSFAVPGYKGSLSMTD